MNIEIFYKEIFPRLPEKLRKKFSFDDMGEICKATSLANKSTPINDKAGDCNEGLVREIEAIELLESKTSRGFLLNSAEIHEEETMSCPACDGQGEVDCETFINMDKLAVNVQFSGIGWEMINNQKFIESIPSLMNTLRKCKAALQANSDHFANLSKMEKPAIENVGDKKQLGAFDAYVIDEQEAAWINEKQALNALSTPVVKESLTTEGQVELVARALVETTGAKWEMIERAKETNYWFKQANAAINAMRDK